MIVDVHTRIWDEASSFAELSANKINLQRAKPWERLDASTIAHQKAIEPVGAAFVLGFHSAAMDTYIAEQSIAKYIAQSPEKLIGFAGIDPLTGKLKNKLDNAQNLGLKGVTINPAAQGLHPTHTKAIKLYELCQKRSLPIIIEGAAALGGAAKLQFDQPYLLDEAIEQFPNLNIILTAVDDSWLEQALMLLARHKKVYLDLSAQINRPWALYKALVSTYQRGVIDKLLFSSNFPFISPEDAILTIYSTNTLVQGSNLPSVPREQLRSIVERDTLALLGLAAPQKTDSPSEQVKAA